MRVRTKFLLLLLPPLLLSGLLINYLAGRAVRGTLQERAAEEAKSAAGQALFPASAVFSSGKESLMLPVLYSLKLALNASEAFFVSTDGDILAHTDVAQKGLPLPAFEQPLLSGAEYVTDLTVHGGTMYVAVPVFEPAPSDPEELSQLGPGKAARLGTVIVAVPAGKVLAAEKNISDKITLILVAVYSAILLAASLLTGLALRPVRLLTEGTRLIRLGEYGSVIPVSSGDEFGDLARSFNEMSRTLAGTIVSKNYVDAVVDNLLDVLFVTDQQCRITRSNKAAQAMLRKTAAELEGLDLRPLLSGDGAWPGKCMAALEKDGEVRDHETTLLASEPLPVQLSASWIRDTDGARAGIVVLMRDMTLRRKYEAELARSNEELQRFAFVAAHDLQEPLRTVSNYVQLLESRYGSLLGREAGKDMAFITASLGRMRALVRDLLGYSRINSRLRLERVDSSEALSAVLEGLKDSISSAGGSVTSGELPVLTADRGHIERLLQNLVSNALKFRGERRPAVRVDAARRGAGWVFSVADNGEGIDPRYADKLFKLFGRLHGASVEGAGIGLAVCKKIVEQYGGDIWFESKPGEGATFFFEIPDKKAEAEEVP